MEIKISLASKQDREQLSNFFKHYKVNEIAKNRVDCYTLHNFTVVAKNGDKIVGIIQWYVKENPEAGVAEFEEFFVSEDYRGKGIGSRLIKYAINSVKEYFEKIQVKPRKIFLFTSKSNETSRKVFEKHGFKIISEVGDLFSDGVVEMFYCFKF